MREQVCVGSHPQVSAVQRPGLTIPDEIPASHGLRFTAVVGCHGHHREFIVYDGLQAYPEYLVKYRRV